MQPQTLKISVVIPCHNEETNIGHCLDSLNRQTVKPLEIIVVDNNCSDKTIEIARAYKLVKIVVEKRQGLVWARSAGMNRAHGDLIARLDADSRPVPDWLATVEQIFSNRRIQAATGTGYFYDAPFKKLVRAYRNIFAVWLNRLILGHHMLWGSNMALRRSSWLLISRNCCMKRQIMEDLDIAAHVYQHFGKDGLAYQLNMRVDISGRRALTSLKHNWLYLKMWPRTLGLHNYRRRIFIWPAIMALLGMSPFLRLMRIYNVDEARFIFTLAQWRSRPLFDKDNP